MAIDLDRVRAELGGYEAADRASDALDRIYASAATLINADPGEIALVENATVAWQLAFHSLRLEPGDRVITVRNEYASAYIGFLHRARRDGFAIETIPTGPDGTPSPEALAAMIDGRVKLIALPHVPSHNGTVNQAAALGRIARGNGIPFLLDACQSVGQLAVDVDALGCDMLAATGRKYLRGPRGTGFLYVRRSMLERLDPVFLDLHGARWTAPDRYEMRPGARRFENWESNIAAQLGLGAAIDYALALGPHAIETRGRALAADLRAPLAAIAGVTVTDSGQDLSGIVTFHVAGRKSTEIVATLRARDINCVTSSPMVSRLESAARDLPTLLRASVHYYNSEDEVERYAATIAGIAR